MNLSSGPETNFLLGDLRAQRYTATPPAIIFRWRRCAFRAHFGSASRVITSFATD
jgi:hypothetical protein